MSDAPRMHDESDVTDADDAPEPAAAGGSVAGSTSADPDVPATQPALEVDPSGATITITAAAPSCAGSADAAPPLNATTATVAQQTAVHRRSRCQ